MPTLFVLLMRNLPKALQRKERPLPQTKRIIASILIMTALTACSNNDSVSNQAEATVVSPDTLLETDITATKTDTDMSASDTLLNAASSDDTSPIKSADINPSSLAAARSQHRTTVKESSQANSPLPTPPPAIFDTLYYPSGKDYYAAFVSPDPGDGNQHPAIIWITGGESNTVGNVWEVPDPSNDQNATPYREAGIIMMFPTLRGGNDNSGHIEYNYGEVNDIIAAANTLKALPYVNPERIYLGGHSTGGTLALLVSEVVSQQDPTLFKGIISFGATGHTLLHEFDDDTEYKLRAPAFWTQDIKVPTLAIEGMQPSSNYESLKQVCELTENPKLTCAFPKRYDHFNVLYPVNRHLALQIFNNQPLSLEDAGF